MREITSEIFVLSQNIPPEGFAAKHKRNAETSSHATRPTILVVDDQHLIANTTAMVLNHAGFQAERAYNGHSALEMALKLKPDFLLSDILMPEMNGVELAIAVRKQLPSTIIVLISGQAGVTDILRHAKDEGFEFDLLAKPIHPRKLLEHLKARAPQFWE